MVTVPASPLVLVLAAIDRPTVPLPEPLAPEVTVIQEALLDAVHEQPLFAVTATLVVPPVALNA